ncbi:IS66 family transposase zinc-finger binding domain-containing protein [Methylohalobius crimeensis]|uniref:IS66 family transposase zinc-finger binding domain-containing protein n=1 Tax=Methylohalobius crimeensis TaxID=244365 RepID=UPI0038993C3A
MPPRPRRPRAPYLLAQEAGRKPLPAELPRVRIEHDMSEAEKVCDCGGPLSPIGEDISEQLEIVPAKIRVRPPRSRTPCSAGTGSVE